MNELEMRFYSLAEISEITGIPANASQFARDVKRMLKNEGYACEWLKKRGVNIINRTITPQMELKKLLMERFSMNTQADVMGFAWFIIALTTVSGFASMPYLEKEKVITEMCGYDIDEGTLRHWAGKLYKSGNANRTKKGALWHTYRDENGVKRQEPADPDGEAYKEYCDLRTIVLNCIRETDDKNNASPEVRKGAYRRMLRQLYSEYGCYYWCPEIVLNALGDDIEEIIRLVDAILL